MPFPATRMRRLRRTDSLRSLVREHRLHPTDFILPLFVQHGHGKRDAIQSLPGQARLSIELAVEEAARAYESGVRALLLFGLPSHKDEAATQAYDDEGIVHMAVRAIRQQLPDMTVMTDVCLCQYTTHGHCGVVSSEGEVLNDVTLQLLADTAVSHARAGAHVVAPSDMMDGRVAAIRESLDAEGLDQVAILSYSAKFASAFYGPFREAADSSPQFGDRRAYQMDPANRHEALREAALDVSEGADMLMVKPALAYLDLVRDIKSRLQVPVAAYQVSGEYAMIHAAAANGWIDGKAAMLEALTSIKRAGADLIISYASTDAATWIAEGRDSA